MNLVVVESPNKCQKIQSFLGDNFCVTASVGHIREIPQKGMNIDISGGFVPVFEWRDDKRDAISKIKELAKKADKIYLAADMDREGEGIAQEVFDLLDRESKKKCQRITFTEITKKAVAEAIKKPREIDKNLVDAQKARQVLDRLIGYTASPMLWNTVGKGTSAGRVQSIALKLIVERQAEIDAFVPMDFWYVDANLKCSNGSFIARVVADEKGKDQKPVDELEKTEKEPDERQSGKFRFLKEKLATEAVSALKTANYVLDKVERKEKVVKPLPPFDTTSMQTTCASVLGWDATKTMKVAQTLYEGGVVTYIRSDCYNIADEALAEVRDLIEKQQGKDYLPTKANIFEKKSSAASQEAHECIRPTHVNDSGETMSGDEKALYDLIRLRFIACQMSPMVLNTVVYHVRTNTKHHLVARGQTVRFDGFSKVYKLRDAKEEILPNAEENEELTLKDLKCTKHSTKPPERYNDGTLVKKMESEGIGRPSTRAQIIKNIQDKGYVEKDKKAFVPTELGKRVCAFLSPVFKSHFMDIKFTAGLEEALDLLADGKKGYLEVVKPVYEALKSLKDSSDPKSFKESPKSTGKQCTVCKKGEIVEKIGKFGKFFCCDKYPDCKTIFLLEDGVFSVKKPGVSKPTGEKCQRCDKGKIVEKKGQYGAFFACDNYPACKTIYLRDSRGEYVVK